jgi:hypothetical protein
MNLTPFALVGTIKASAKFLSSIGNSPTCATKAKCVRAEPVATTLAPVTQIPASVSRVAWA